jgi:cytochrome c-type biogenesis protein CcmE
MQTAAHRPGPGTEGLGRPAGASAGPRLKILFAGGALVVGVAYLILTALQTSTVYYLTVGELLGKGASVYGQQLRVAGDVTPGSVSKEDAGLAIRFLVEDGTGRIPVYYRGGPVPDIFGEQVQVVVEGKYGADGTFVASTLLAKCPSKFETDGAADA